MEQAILGKSDHRVASGIRMRQAIDAVAMPQVRAAEIMGITKNHLGNMLRGEGPIPSYELYRFCRATGVTADWVLLGDPSGLPQRVARALLSPTPVPSSAD